MEFHWPEDDRLDSASGVTPPQDNEDATEDGSKTTSCGGGQATVVLIDDSLPSADDWPDTVVSGVLPPLVRSCSQDTVVLDSPPPSIPDDDADTQLLPRLTRAPRKRHLVFRPDECSWRGPNAKQVKRRLSFATEDPGEPTTDDPCGGWDDYPSWEQDPLLNDDAETATTDDQLATWGDDTLGRAGPLNDVLMCREKKGEDQPASPADIVQVGPSELATIPHTPEMSDIQKKLFDHTVQYLQNMPDDDAVSGIVKKAFELVKTPDQFIAALYTSSTTCAGDYMFWLASKLITVGASHSIDLGATAGAVTKKKLTPVQFGGVKSQDSYIGIFNQDLGAYGEKWVYVHMLQGGLTASRPGKIGKRSFPLSATTPDYLMHSGRNDNLSGVPIVFSKGAVVGVGECKTSFLSRNTSPTVWTSPDTTVSSIINDTKPRMIKDIFTNPSSQKTHSPNWLGTSKDLLDKLMVDIKHTTQWKMDYFEDMDEHGQGRTTRVFDMRLKKNQFYLKPLTCSVGKQMICEALSVLDYTKSPTMRLCGYFPSCKDIAETGEKDACKNNVFKVAYCLYCTMDLSVETLKELDKVVNANLANAMHSVAVDNYIFSP